MARGRGAGTGTSNSGGGGGTGPWTSGSGLVLMNALYDCTLNVRNALIATMAHEGVEFVTPEEALTRTASRSTSLSYCVRSARECARTLAYLVEDARAFARGGAEPLFSLSDVRLTQERDVRESYTLMRLVLYMHTDECDGTGPWTSVDAPAVDHDY